MKKKKRHIIFEYLLITIGLILVSIGVYYFLVPSNLAAGGVSGIAMIVNKYIPVAPIGLLMLIMNIILFIISFILIGPNFGGRSIYASLGISGCVLIFEKFMPIKEPLTNDLMITMIFGILICAIGMAVLFNTDSSTGGTDIIAKILNKYFHIDIGKALLMSDFLITIGAGATFGIRTGMYAVLAVIINGFLIDSVIDGLNICKEVTIISQETDNIVDFIVNKLRRGVTIYEATGGYTGDNKKVLRTIVKREQFIKLIQYIGETDSEAFITVKEVNEVLGKGFKDLND